MRRPELAVLVVLSCCAPLGVIDDGDRVPPAPVSASTDAGIPLGEDALPTTLVLDARGAVVLRLHGVLLPGVLDAKLSRVSVFVP